MQTHDSSNESHAADVLTQFQARPSPQAYQRMSQAPWLAPQKTTPKRMVTVAATLLLLVLLTGLVWVTPPLRTLAQDILDHLFRRAPENTTTWEIDSTPPPNVPASVAESFGSVARASARTGLKIHQPDSALVPYPLTGVTVNHSLEAAWLIYAHADGYLSIYQRSAALGWLDEGWVGKDAPIIAVTIKTAAGTELKGEYIAGGWALEGTPVPSADGVSQVPANWTTHTAQRRLRWQDSDTVYEMMTLDPDLGLVEMLKIAASMH